MGPDFALCNFRTDVGYITAHMHAYSFQLEFLQSHPVQLTMKAQRTCNLQGSCNDGRKMLLLWA